MQEWEAELHEREARLVKWRGALTIRDRWRLCRDAGGAFWDALWLRSSGWPSLRFLVKHRRLTVAVVFSLGAAMATTIVGVGVYEALLLRPPGVRDAGALLTIYVRSPEGTYR